MKIKYVRLNIDLNDRIVEEIKLLTNLKTKKEVVNEALRFYRDLLIKEGQHLKALNLKSPRAGGPPTGGK